MDAPMRGPIILILTPEEFEHVCDALTANDWQQSFGYIDSVIGLVAKLRVLAAMIGVRI
jgi:hypothetical protein